jgi:outer membrane protein TolC
MARMRSIAIALVLAGLVLSFSPRAAAQVQTPVPVLATQITLAEALEQALARNRDLAVSRREVDVSRGQLRQARRYPFNPELVVEGEAGRSVGREDAERRGVGGGKIGISQVIEVRGTARPRASVDARAHRHIPRR